MRKILKKIGISLLVIFTVFILGVFGLIYAEYNAIFYDKFKIEFDNQTNEEIIDVYTYFDNQAIRITGITPERSYVRVINDRYTNLDNVDLSTFGIKAGIIEDIEYIGESDILYFPAEYGKTYHVTITGDRENGLILNLNE